VTSTLLLVRHGETAHNAEGRWQGQSDIPLSDIGREQARRLAAVLPLMRQDLLPSVVYSSDLSRAVETAQILQVSIGNPEHHQSPAFRERGYGSWEGKSRAECAEHWPGHTRPHDGEAWTAVYKRMTAGLSDVLKQHQGDSSIMIVGHGASLKAIIANVLYPGLDHHEPPGCLLSNTGLTVIQRGGDAIWRIERLNDTRHLENAQ
jgi:broad specificity phosphatase PhoE